MTPPRPDTSPRRSAAVALPAYGLAAVTLAGFAGGWHWLLDLTSHTSAGIGCWRLWPGSSWRRAD